MVNNNDFCFAFTPGEELTSRCFSYHVLETGCRMTEEQQSFVYLLLLMKQREMLVQMLVHLRRLISVCRCAADECTKRYYTPRSCCVVRQGSAAFVLERSGRRRFQPTSANARAALGREPVPPRSWRDALECQSCCYYNHSAESGSHSFGHHRIPFYFLPQASAWLKRCVRWAVAATSHLAGARSLTNGSGETP